MYNAVSKSLECVAHFRWDTWDGKVNATMDNFLF